ncbi:MAG: LacI family DNA-binding transcriptional regulator [Saprospiraceae bacterium]|nr:LacI family DNA-binding transcriptional regulator [Saprospiraceae bacterium]
MNKITIKDIAKMLSVSVSTVSRALADHPDISDETKTRVKEVAQKFNYLPNLHARFFRKKNTRMIALILPEFNRFFIPDLIKGIQQYADVQGYKLIIFQSGNQYETEAEIIKYCLSWVVEGVLISLSDDTGSLDHLKILKDSKIPVVLLDKVMTSKEYPTVTIDGFDAAYTATSAILQRGRKIFWVFLATKTCLLPKTVLKALLQPLKTTVCLKQNMPISKSETSSTPARYLPKKQAAPTTTVSFL